MTLSLALECVCNSGSKEEPQPLLCLRISGVIAFTKRDIHPLTHINFLDKMSRPQYWITLDATSTY